ncbi:hypothetical protein F6Q07_07295 [Pectobacterium parmentieri]|uniref:Uncharacterized protein n=1 Tax=Pectobacterium parmentieri TaxID=1905730 RepID=A0ABS0RUJ9_PECPM|nr:hypothetical protein C5E26_23390 [Pectobacterium parmentieri]AYH07984.1 hypothetical protein C5E25_22885 [Pectobacterium parmentieri]AYH12456.1 hypothetical protein C5E24_23635 [Pectobacterium parmentieri]AYH16736.1 hypothetical protein C5E23_22500 [Pectobacterium parmentieri]AYH21172.1 hypothetical protein C5E22_23515 [Pectobacterium parmentieri]
MIVTDFVQRKGISDVARYNRKKPGRISERKSCLYFGVIKLSYSVHFTVTKLSYFSSCKLHSDLITLI